MILGNAYLSLFFDAGQNPKVLGQAMSAYKQAVSCILHRLFLEEHGGLGVSCN